MRLDLDHIVVSATTLEDGVAYVQDTLGVTMAAGGKHPAMGTHNRLLGLGETYLEVIAIDPDAPPPSHPRWFDLDNFSGPPRLTNWVAKTQDLNGALALAPPGIGTARQLTRDDLVWTVGVSDDGTLPFDGAFPGLIDWGDTQHPTQRLQDLGLALVSWSVSHPDGERVKAAMALYAGGLHYSLIQGEPGFEAQIATPDGLKILR